jgi:hypothetical protein
MMLTRSGVLTASAVPGKTGVRRSSMLHPMGLGGMEEDYCKAVPADAVRTPLCPS